MPRKTAKLEDIIPLLKILKSNNKERLVFYGILFRYYKARDVVDKYLSMKDIRDAVGEVSGIVDIHEELTDYDIANAVRKTLKKFGAVVSISKSRKYVYWTVNEDIIPLLEEYDPNVKKIKEVALGSSSDSSRNGDKS